MTILPSFFGFLCLALGIAVVTQGKAETIEERLGRDRQGLAGIIHQAKAIVF